MKYCVCLFTFKYSLLSVNTRAAEVLYSTVGEWADLNENTILLDVCCGTGTIGLTLAKVRLSYINLSQFPQLFEEIVLVNSKHILTYLNFYKVVDYHGSTVYCLF